MKKLFSFLFLLAATLTAFCQSAVVPAGGTATGNGGSATYTVGQIADQRVEASGKYIIEGVQQPFEISGVGVNNYPGIQLEAVLYPNPTNQFVRLRISNFEIPDYGLTAQLYDINGKLLQVFNVADLETEMDLSVYAAATYHLRVMDNTRLLKTFKIVKNTF
jgi:hypothetical protein